MTLLCHRFSVISFHPTHFDTFFSPFAEIRCVPPEVPKNATVVYGGNDRASADSFRVGSTVQYRCIAGHLPVRGEPLRTCLPTGVWSNEPPLCMCMYPFIISTHLNLHCFVNNVKCFLKNIKL